MTEFIYNNTKNRSTIYIVFEFNFKYRSQVFWKNETNSYSKSHSIHELIKKLKKLIIICYKKLLYFPNLKKKHVIKRQAYELFIGKKISVNNKHIKTKRNDKLKNKFFKLFYVLYCMSKQIYKPRL